MKVICNVRIDQGHYYWNFTRIYATSISDAIDYAIEWAERLKTDRPMMIHVTRIRVEEPTHD